MLRVLSVATHTLGARPMIEQLVQQIEARFAELGALMTDPAVIGDRERYAEVGRAYRQLEAAAALAAQWRRATDDAAGAEELLAENGEDPELREMLGGARRRIAELEEEIRLAMVEADPNDDKNVIVEIQGGAGGEEAGLWAGDLYRMLTKYAERLGFTVEAMDVGDGKYTFAIKGTGAYSVFKYEGGTHRVQRVPATESQGRIHTSTATVAVLPEAEDVDVQSTPTTCRSTCTAPGAPAASRSTPPTRRCASRIARAESSSPCRMRRASSRTARRRCACCARAVRARARRAAGRARRRPALAGG